MSTRERLQRIEAKVRQMEQALGLDNPQVNHLAFGHILASTPSHIPACRICHALPWASHKVVSDAPARRSCMTSATCQLANKMWG